MLKMEHVRKSYGTFSLDCSLEIMPGRITGLIGQNGAGKSTTFKLALGVTSPESGSISVMGRNIKELGTKEKQEWGVVLSDSGFSGYLTIKDIIPILENLYEKFDKAFFQERIKKFGLPEHKKIKDFSKIGRAHV